MNDSSIFDLESAIRHWRSELQQLPAFSNANVEELEGHLRDAIAALQKQSLNQEEAFWLARRRLGSAERLEREFRPVNTAHIWQQRMLWMVAGFLIILSLNSGVASVVRLMLVAGFQAGIPTAAGSWLHPVLQCAGLGALFFWAHQVFRPANQSTAVIFKPWTSPWKHGLMLTGAIIATQILNALSLVIFVGFVGPQGMAGFYRAAQFISVLFWPIAFIWMMYRAQAASVPSRQTVR